MLGHDQMSFQTEYDQKFPLIQYILFITSIVSLWIPFAVCQTSIEMVIYLKKYIARNQTIISKLVASKFRIRNYKSIKLFIKIIFQAICITGMIYHSIDLTSHYLEYSMGNMISISNSRSQEVPSFSLCEPLQFLDPKQNYSWDNYDSKLPEWGKGIFTDTLYDMLFKTENLTFAEMGFNTGKGLHELLTEGDWKSDQKFIKSHSKIYIHSSSKCIAFMYPVDFQLSHSEKSYTWLQIMGLRFSHSKIRHFILLSINVHPSEDIARGMILPMVQYWSHDTAYLLIDFFQTRYLPAPFEPSCIDYDVQTDLGSEENCFEKCVDSYWLKNNPKYAPMQMSFTSEELMKPENRDRKLYKAFPNLTLNIECMKQCPVDCTTIQYQVNQRPKFSTSKKGQIQIIMEFTGLKTNIQYYQKLELYEFLVLIAGIAGLWMGFSFYSSAQDLVEVVVSLFNHPKRENHEPSSMNRLFTSRKYIRYFFLVIFTIFMMIHVVFMTSEYLKYDTQNEVMAEYEKKFKAPQDSICWDITCLIRNESFPASSSCVTIKGLSHKERETCRNEIISNYPLDKIMNDLTSDPIQAIRLLEIFDSDYDQFKNVSRREMRSYFDVFYKHPFKCIKTKFNLDEKSEYIVDLDKLLKHRKGIYYYYEMDGKKLLGYSPLKIFYGWLSGMVIFTTPQGHYPWSHKIAEDKHFFGENYIEFTGSDIIDSETLPAPVTRCHDYSDSGIRTREECIEVCISKKQDQMVKKLPQIIYHSPFESIKLQHNPEIFRKFLEDCESRCPEWCTTINFELKRAGNDVSPKLLTGYGKRHVFITTRIKFSLKFPLMDYIIYVGGIHGLWFGLSIVAAGIETASMWSTRKVKKPKRII